MQLIIESHSVSGICLVAKRKPASQRNLWSAAANRDQATRQGLSPAALEKRTMICEHVNRDAHSGDRTLGPDGSTGKHAEYGRNSGNAALARRTSLSDSNLYLSNKVKYQYLVWLYIAYGCGCSIDAKAQIEGVGKPFRSKGLACLHRWFLGGAGLGVGQWASCPTKSDARPRGS